VKVKKLSQARLAEMVQKLMQLQKLEDDTEKQIDDLQEELGKYLEVGDHLFDIGSKSFVVSVYGGGHIDGITEITHRNS
jgi:hypothetical protein